MPIDPAMLAKSIATLTDLDPERDLAATLDQAVVAAKQLFGVDAAGIMLADADGRLRWASASDPLAQVLEDNQETFAAGPCLQAFASGRPAVIHDATLEPPLGRDHPGLCRAADPLGVERPGRARRRPDRHLGCVRRRPRRLGPD